jgi:hypothetical protein
MRRNWNRRKVVFAAGLVLLSLLLAGCGGLFQNPVVKEAVPIAPSAPAMIYRPDPRLLGESFISGEYIPDRLVVGHRTTTKGYENFGKIFALLGEEIVAEVILDDVRIVSFRLKNGLSVEEALGLALLLVTGKLDPENPREPMEDILFVEPDYEFRPQIPVNLVWMPKHSNRWFMILMRIFGRSSGGWTPSTPKRPGPWGTRERGSLSL